MLKIKTINPALFIFLFIPIITSCQSLSPRDMTKVANQEHGKATIYLFNLIGGIKMGGELMVVNEIPIGKLDRREYTWLNVPSGELKISFNDTLVKSRKLAANVFTVEKGKTYYIGYEIKDSVSDGALLYEAFSGQSKNKDYFKSHYIYKIEEFDSKELINEFKLVGNKITLAK